MLAIRYFLSNDRLLTANPRSRPQKSLQAMIQKALASENLDLSSCCLRHSANPAVSRNRESRMGQSEMQFGFRRPIYN